MSKKTRRLIWSVPLVAVFAVVGALAAFGALGIGGVFANEVTSQPMNLNVSPADGSAGRTALVLTWDAPASGETPTGYRVDVSKNNKTYTFLTTTDADTRTYTHSGVPGSTSGTTRHYRVFAMNQHGAGRVSTWEGGTTEKITTPDQVKPFDWTSTDPTKVVLIWTAPDDGGAGILGYCIRAWPTGTTEPTLTAITATNCTNSFATEGPGGSGGAYPNGPGGIIRILPATTYTHSNLKAEQKWSYEIYAVNKHGYSADMVSATRNATAADAKNPSPPGSLLAVQDTDTTNRIINLYWTKPDAMGQDITGYEIEVSDRKSQWPSPNTPRLEADRLTVDDDKIADGITPEEGRLAPETTIVPGTINTSPFVAIITMTDATQTAVRPYQLRHTYDTVDPDGDGTDATVTKRFASKLYYRVRTITNNDDMDSELKSMSYAYADVLIGFDVDASPVGFVTPVLAPLVGADAASTAGTLNEDTGGDIDNDDDSTPGEVHLTASHQTDNAGSYRVDVSTDDGATWVTRETDSLPINAYDYRGPDVKPGKGYRFRLFSKLVGLGLASDVVQDFAGHSKAPGEVRSLTATKDDAGMINLSWDHPTSDGGATIDTYCIVASQFGDGGAPSRAQVMVVDTPGTPILEANCTRFGEPDKSPISIDDDVFQVEGTTTSVAFKGVLAETQWFFRVYGLNGATGPTDGTGASTVASLIRGLAAGSERNDATTDSAVVPGAPGYLTAEDARDTNVQGVGKQGVLVLWTAPSNPAGAPVLGYKVERSTDDGANYTTLTDNLNTGETHIVDDIERPTDESRVYRVTSINSVDVGTETITVMLPLAEHTTHTTPPAVDELTAPSITAATPGTGTITVEWTPGENADGHLAMLFTDDFVADPVVATKTETDTTHTFPNVANGGYVVVVVSYDNSFDFQFVFTPVSVPAN
jgi:hypothetical protein